MPLAGAVLHTLDPRLHPADLTYIEPLFVRFWLPDSFVFMQQIPRTAVGKFQKSALREQLKEHRFPDA